MVKVTVVASLMANYSGKADGWTARPDQFVRLVGRPSIISQLYKVNICILVLFWEVGGGDLACE